MNNVFWIFLSLSLSGSLVALVLFLLRPVIQHRLSRAWQYYMFLVVILRLLVPFGFEVNPADRLFGKNQGSTAAAVSHVTEEAAAPAPGARSDQALPPGIVPEGARPVSGRTRQILHWGWLVWLLPAIVLLLRKIMGYRAYVRSLKAGGKSVASPDILAVYRRACAHAGVSRAPGLLWNDAITTPMLAGVFHPVIALPGRVKDKQKLGYMLHHELTHYRRFDIGYKWIVQLAVCLHWFNPLVHWISRQINRSCELACDEAVLGRLDQTQRRAYGDMLLETVICGQRQPAVAGSIMLGQDAKLVKERLGAIMNYKKKSGITVALSVMLAALIMIGAACGGANLPQNNEPDGTRGDPPQSQSTEPATQGQGEGSDPTQAGDSLTEPTTESVEPTQAGGTQPQSTAAQQSFMIESVEMRAYTGENAHPYIHSITVNQTDKAITGYQREMIAFDQEGNPLMIDWWGMSDEDESTYSYLFTSDIAEHAPGERIDTNGGWSLNVYRIDPEVEKIAYVLYCMKEITFEDGTVWSNPDYETWRDIYVGQKVSVETLESYYPYVQLID